MNQPDSASDDLIVNIRLQEWLDLKAENARLREALEKIRDYIPIDEMTVAPALPVAPRRLQEIARAALSSAA